MGGGRLGGSDGKGGEIIDGKVIEQDEHNIGGTFFNGRGGGIGALPPRDGDMFSDCILVCLNALEDERF